MPAVLRLNRAGLHFTRSLLVLTLAGASLISAADRELTGRVVDADTGQPVARAHVTLRFYQGGQPAPEVTLLSDSDGVFKITSLPAGGYQVSCEKAGYLPASQGMTPNPADGSAPAAMTLRLTAQAAVEGTVTDDRDMPAANTFLQLVRQQVVNGRRQFQIAGSGSTDETGSFRIFELPAGHYFIAITARLNGARRTKPVAYPQLFYPGALDIETAQPVDLKAGDEAQIKIQLPGPIPAYEVRGAVATASSDVSVSLTRQPAGSMLGNQGGESSWDPKTKTFKISHVTPGMYLLTAFARDGAYSMRAATTISVGSADVAGIRLELVESALDGTVHSDSGAAQARMFVSLQSGSQGTGAPVDGEGKFHVVNLQPGTYRIAMQTGPQMCVRSMLQGGRDVRDGIAIAAGVVPTPVDIVLTSHCGSVDITVSTDSALPPNLSAFLLHKTGDEFVLEKQGNVAARSGDSAGHSLMQGVAPGEYLLFAWPQEAQIEYTNAEYMKPFESYGQAVTVTEDSKSSVTIDKVLSAANF